MCVRDIDFYEFRTDFGLFRQSFFFKIYRPFFLHMMFTYFILFFSDPHCSQSSQESNMGSPHSDNKDGDISSDDAFTAQTKIEPPDDHTPRSIYTEMQKAMPNDNSLQLMGGNPGRMITNGSATDVSNMFQDYQTL